jgi:hypothetical protein
MTEKTFTERQRELIEKHRDINTDYEWWDCIYDSFQEDMKQKHIEVQDMRFSGFCSQGDGASFTGYIDDNKAFFEDHGLTETYPYMMKLLSHGGGFSLCIERSSSRYVHENTVSAELSYCDNFSCSCVLRVDDPLREAVVKLWDEALQREYDTICDTVTDIIRGYCRDLYRKLEEEYDYLTSDEAIWEAIEANELDEEEETV